MYRYWQWIWLSCFLWACTPQEHTAHQQKQWEQGTNKKFDHFLQQLHLQDSLQGKRGNGEAESHYIIKSYQEGVEYMESFAYGESTFILALSQASVQEGMQYAKTWFDANSKIGYFLHHVFADSIPTTKWEQLIHLGNHEATIISRTNQETDELLGIYIDIDQSQDQHSFLTIEAANGGVTISWADYQHHSPSQY